MVIKVLKGKGYRNELVAYLNKLLFILYQKRRLLKLSVQATKICGTLEGEDAKWFGMPASAAITGQTSIISDAVELTKRQINILGQVYNYKGRSIPWAVDPLSNISWKKKYYKLLYPVGGRGDCADCKMPWELSRFQHLPCLAKAYTINGDRRYLQEAVWQINDWIDENPCLYGINWTCAMEAAIRACNWMWAWWAFKDEPEWTEEFDRKFLTSMWQHGWYIEHNLEDKGGIRTNHYLSDVVGLLFIGTMFPGFKDAAKWRAFGVKELVRCMDEMVYEDGVSFENSTAYHRFVLELFTYSAILCGRNDISLPQAFWRRLEKMFEFILYTIRPDGKMPMIGDNDDGRFFILANYYDWERWDYRYLLAIAAVLFNRADFKTAAGRFHEEVYRLFGEDGYARFRQL